MTTAELVEMLQNADPDGTREVLVSQGDGAAAVIGADRYEDVLVLVLAAADDGLDRAAET
jgi:hypothetical protein